MKLFANALVFFVMTAAVSTGAIADTQETGVSARDARARDLFYRGEEHYAAGRYQRAATLYEEAYELSGRGELLFNAANAFERLGEYRTATKYLKMYLKSGKARDAMVVRRRIARLKRKEVERQAAKDRELERIVRTRANRVRETERAREETESSMTGMEKAAYYTLGGAGVLLASGVAFGVASSSAGRSAAKLCDGELCRSSAKGALDRERRFAVFSDVGIGLGLAGGAVGGYLLWKAKKEKRSRSVTLVPTLGQTVGVGIHGSF